MNKSKINPTVLQLVGQIPNVDQTFDREHFCLFAQELFSQSDRAAVIVGAVNLGELLRRALKKLAPAEKRSGGNFSTRIDLALIHGIVHKDLWEWLHDLRWLRNEFAHALLLGTDLNDPIFAECVTRLTQPGWPGKIYYQIAEACDCNGLSEEQINVRTRIVAYCEKLRRAVEDPRRMPVRWIQPPGPPTLFE